MSSTPFLLDFILDFFPACGTGRVLEKLPDTAAPVGAGDHQGLVAALASILDKGRLAAVGARDVGWPAAAGTDALLLDNWPHTGRTGIAKWTLAAAAGAKTGVTVDQLAAMDAELLVTGHAIPPDGRRIRRKSASRTSIQHRRICR